MKKLPLIEGLKKYLDENNSPFSMPGHKQGRGFNIPSLGINLNDIITKIDLTEVDGIDNLHKPENIIKESLDMLKSYYNSKKSYFLVNGSTSGNLMMIFSALEEGDNILVERNCHKSIFSGIIMRKLNPIYLNNIINEDLNIPIALDIENLKKIIKDKSIKAIILTYPNYYGIGCNLEEVIKICNHNKVKVLIDSAHGAHFGVNSKLPKSAVKLGADMIVMSSHKTLPSLTQTAFLHVNDKSLLEKVDFYFGVFSSTSPSYMLMASMDYGRAFLQYEGENEYELLIERLRQFKENIKNIKEINIVDSKFLRDDLEKYKICIDSSRLILNLEKGYSAHKFADYLRKNKIQVEMSDEKNIVLITTPFNNENDFKRLTSVIVNCDFEKLKGKIHTWSLYDIPKMVIPPYEAMNKEKIKVKLKDSENMICGENIIPYPPGVPLLMIGEKITKEYIKIIQELQNSGVTILGFEDNNIKIIKNKV